MRSLPSSGEPDLGPVCEEPGLVLVLAAVSYPTPLMAVRVRGWGHLTGGGLNLRIQTQEAM